MSKTNSCLAPSRCRESLFLKALRQEPVPRTPVWLMRQAGRYMPEYRKIRASEKDFIALCENADKATEVTLLPIQQFQLDAAIIFSDILLMGQAMGAPLAFLEGEGPIFEPVRTQKQVEGLLAVEAADHLTFVYDAIRQTASALGETPLIGFCGSPWTVATYMVEGGTSKLFETIKTMAWQAPTCLQALLAKLTEASTAYLKRQIQAGASALMIFDTWGGILPFHAVEQFSLQYIRQMIAALKADPDTRDTPVIVFSKGVNTVLPLIAQTGADAVSLDWTVDLHWARTVIPEMTLQGNLDPTLLLGAPETLKAAIGSVLNAFGPNPGHIFNLGHGILPQTDPDQVKRLVEWVAEISQSIKTKET